MAESKDGSFFSHLISTLLSTLLKCIKFELKNLILKLDFPKGDSELSVMGISIRQIQFQKSSFLEENSLYSKYNPLAYLWPHEAENVEKNLTISAFSFWLESEETNSENQQKRNGIFHRKPILAPLEFLCKFRFASMGLKTVQVEVNSLSVELDSEDLRFLIFCAENVSNSLGEKEGAFTKGVSNLQGPKSRWKWAVSKITGRFPKESLQNAILLAGKRRRYAILYEEWLLRQKVGKEKGKKRKRMVREKVEGPQLKKELRELEKELSVEAIALSRRMAIQNAQVWDFKGQNGHFSQSPVVEVSVEKIQISLGILDFKRGKLREEMESGVPVLSTEFRGVSMKLEDLKKMEASLKSLSLDLIFFGKAMESFTEIGEEKLEKMRWSSVEIEREILLKTSGVRKHSEGVNLGDFFQDSSETREGTSNDDENLMVLSLRHEKEALSAFFNLRKRLEVSLNPNFLQILYFMVGTKGEDNAESLSSNQETSRSQVPIGFGENYVFPVLFTAINPLCTSIENFLSQILPVKLNFEILGPQITLESSSGESFTLNLGTLRVKSVLESKLHKPLEYREIEKYGSGTTGTHAVATFNASQFEGHVAAFDWRRRLLSSLIVHFDDISVTSARGQILEPMEMFISSSIFRSFLEAV